MLRHLPLLLLMTLLSARTVAADDTVRHARALLEASVAIPTVAGNARVPELARLIAEELRGGGFDASDIEIVPVGETAYLVARYRGASAQPPLVLAVHMDVVEAKREDWSVEPFRVTRRDGFLIGRGVEDNKFELSMLIAELVRLKREGFVPDRDILFVATGDEETTMISTRALTERLRGAWMVINADGDANPLDDGGKPQAFRLQAAEKTFASFELHVSNEGGHSSRPRRDNAIYRLANALVRIESYGFPIQLSDLTRAYLEGLAEQESGALSEAIRALLADPGDAAAGATLSANPAYVGIVRTTCVATMIRGGHAENALPQSAVATVNCRILPGTSIDSVHKQLETVIADPGVALVLVERYPEPPASPLREDVLAAVRKAVDLRYPGLPILPSMAAGASDSMYYRSSGLDSYVITSYYMHPDDYRAHGLDERIPEDAIAHSLRFWDRLLRELLGG